MSSEVVELDAWSDDPPWFEKIDIDEYERLAGIGYDPPKIAMYYRIRRDDFMYYFNLIGSPLKYHFERGQLMQQAKEGLAMAAAAEKGDNVTQAQRFDKLRTAVGYRNSVNNIFFDDIG